MRETVRYVHEELVGELVEAYVIHRRKERPALEGSAFVLQQNSKVENASLQLSNVSELPMASIEEFLVSQAAAYFSHQSSGGFLQRSWSQLTCLETETRSLNSLSYRREYPLR